MDNFEIILKDFAKKNLDDFLNSELMKYKKMIKLSHFYDNSSKKDLTIDQISSISKILSPIGCGSISFSDFKFGIFFGNTVVTFSFDENVGDIVINFDMRLVFGGGKEEIINNFKKIIEAALELKKKYLIPTILIGFEPADDKDTCLLEIDNKEINLQKTLEGLLNSIKDENS